MNLKLINVSLLLILAQFVCAQTDFQSGYIVKLNGDTLHGLVNFQKEALNISSCNFKSFEIAVPFRYAPENIKGYGIIHGKQYISITLQQKHFFAEYIVQGKISLLYLTKKGKQYFILLPDGNTVELKSGKTTDQKANKTYEHYKDFLLESMKPVDLKEEIQNSRLELNSLSELIINYNKLAKVSYRVPQRPTNKMVLKDYSILGSKNIRFGILGGVTSFQFAVSGNDYYYDYITKASFHKDITPIGGIYLTGSLSKRIPELSFQASLMYQKISILGTNEIIKYPTLIYYDDFLLNLSRVKFQTTINYAVKLPNWTLKPHIGLGFNRLIKSSYQHVSERFDSNANIVTTFTDNNITLNASHFSYLGGITFEYPLFSARILSITMDYEHENKVIDNKMNDYSGEVLLKGSASEITVTLGITL